MTAKHAQYPQSEGTNCKCLEIKVIEDYCKSKQTGEEKKLSLCKLIFQERMLKVIRPQRNRGNKAIP